MKTPCRKKSDVWNSFLESDCDDEYDCLLNVIVFKLKTMEDFFRKQNRSLDLKKYLPKMKEIRGLIEKVIRDSYFDDLLSVEEKKYGKSKFKMIKLKGGGCELKRIGGPPWNVVSKIRKKAFREQNKDLKKAFSMLAESLWDWW